MKTIEYTLQRNIKVIYSPDDNTLYFPADILPLSHVALSPAFTVIRKKAYVADYDFKEIFAEPIYVSLMNFKDRIIAHEKELVTT